MVLRRALAFAYFSNICSNLCKAYSLLIYSTFSPYAVVLSASHGNGRRVRGVRFFLIYGCMTITACMRIRVPSVIMARCPLHSVYVAELLGVRGRTRHNEVRCSQLLRTQDTRFRQDKKRGTSHGSLPETSLM